MVERKKQTLATSIFSLQYWQEAVREFSSVNTLVFAALIVALRILVKFFKISTGGLSFTFDCYVNALGSIVYGPVVALLVGAVSDTIGCIVAPSGTYFLPFILVEMGSSFIFALFLWRRKISAPRVLLSKFTVNLVCNIIMTSTFIKWQYYLLGDSKFYSYNIINGVRIAKNMVMFPIEAILICIILSAMLPPLKSLGVVPSQQVAIGLRKRDIILIISLTLLSVALILFYIFFLKGFVSAHNFKFL